jgi:hypothetical protein
MISRDIEASFRPMFGNVEGDDAERVSMLA